MVKFNQKDGQLVGESGSLTIRSDDEVAKKFAMLIEGECEGVGPSQAARNYGFSKQRYFQLLEAYENGGTTALASQKRGPKTQYRRTSEMVRQIIRYRFLDPQASAEVIAQKLRQLGNKISTRSVERVIEDYGLQKKTAQVRAKTRSQRR